MASFESRGNSVRAIVRLPGGGKRTATFDTRREAEAWAKTMERRKELGELNRSHSGVTVGELFETYLDKVASKTDTAKWNKLRIMSWLNDPLCSKYVTEVITHDINEWIERRLAIPSKRTGRRISGSTVNRELTLMSAAFAYAVKDRKWISVNPCHGARHPANNPSRKRALLTADEIKAICIATGYKKDAALTSLTARVGACFLLSLETGLRSGELLRLRPQDYRKEMKTVHVAAIEPGGRKNARSGRSSSDPSRDVPLTQRAMQLLDQLLDTMPEGQPYIVGMNDSQRDSLWRKARDMAGVRDLHFHDTKHEAATRLARFLDVFELSHAIGTKDLRLLRDTYYVSDAERSAARLPKHLATME